MSQNPTPTSEVKPGANAPSTPGKASMSDPQAGAPGKGAGGTDDSFRTRYHWQGGASTPYEKAAAQSEGLKTPEAGAPEPLKELEGEAKQKMLDAPPPPVGASLGPAPRLAETDRQAAARMGLDSRTYAHLKQTGQLRAG